MLLRDYEPEAWALTTGDLIELCKDCYDALAAVSDRRLGGDTDGQLDQG